MPTYDYECKHCDNIFEVFQSITAPKLKECPTCSHPVKRLIGTGSGILFKGSGFYETDFKTKKGAKPQSKAPKTSKDTKESPEKTKSSESRQSETKTKDKSSDTAKDKT